MKGSMGSHLCWLRCLADPTLDADMPDELDFSRLGKGERGKFYFPKETHHVPYYLDREVQALAHCKAASKGVSGELIADELLRSKPSKR